MLDVMPTDQPPCRTFGKRRSLRLRGHDYTEERAYHVTWGTQGAKRILEGDPARAVVQCLEAEAAGSSVDVLAYCVMPDHVHVLLIPHDGRSAIRFVQTVKSRTARSYAAQHAGDRLWQRGFYDHILRREEDIQTVVAYILAHPVRAGIVEDSPSYPFARAFASPRPSVASELASDVP
jgi:REP element-mobilizing transposase RayT